MKLLSHVRLFATPWTVTYQVPPSMGFSRQEYWSGLPFGHHQNINMNTSTHTPPLYFLLPSAANLINKSWHTFLRDSLRIPCPRCCLFFLFNQLQQRQLGFQVALVVKNLPAIRDMRCKFNPWAGKIPWKRAWQPTLVFLPGESHGQRSLVGYSPQGHKWLDTPEAM